MWPMHQQSLILLHPTIKEKMHLQENTWRNVAQCPLHYVTYAPTEFKVTTSNGLGGEAFTRKFKIWAWGEGHTKCCPVPSTSCDLSICTYRVWSYYVKRFRRSIYKKIQYLTFDLDFGVKVTRNVAKYPLHQETCSATKFEVATLKGLGVDAFTRKFNIWPLTLPLHHVTYSLLPVKVKEEIHLQVLTDRHTDRWTNFGTKYNIFLKKKAGITTHYCVCETLCNQWYACLSWCYLGPNKHGLVTYVQVNVYIGNTLSWLNGGWAF